MYYLTIRQFARTLRNLDGFLAKAEAYAKERKFDVNNFCSMRLSPDMLAFTFQIRSACDHAKGTAAALSGKQAPKHEDNETTFEELRGRVAKCLAYLDTFTEKDFEQTTADMVVKVAYPAGKAMRAQEFLLGRQIPNFYFHVVTAYALLRHGGVDIGKADYLGGIELLDSR